MKRRALWPALLLMVAVPSCGPESAPGDKAEATLDEARVEQLRALGYVESADRVADPAKSGAEVLDADAVSPGYSLYVSPHECSARLITLDGTVVHAWRDELSYDGKTRACGDWHHADLLPGGDLLVPVGAKPQPGQQTGTHLLRMAWDGTVRWRHPMRAHHDAELAPDGVIHALELAFRRDHPYEPGADVPIMDNAVVFLTPEGGLRRRLSLYDVLRENDVGFELRPVTRPEGLWYIDLLHMNSVETLHDPRFVGRHPLYALGNLLLSSRHQDAIFVVDPKTKRLVWWYGPGELSGQHDAQMLPNGNVLVFDNGLDRGWSRVVEIDPVEKKIVWQYGDGDETRFFTSGRGAAQKLPNGNVLVSNSNEGEAFEVTRDGRVVWRFYHPVLDEEGRRRVIVRMIRYPASQIDPLLEGAR
ncbi:MAG TPA: arylsulfotransferase family protein [Myxococcota bacterium]|nr:arylsulfotransferase family protein [Myxococcota bacterium]